MTAVSWAREKEESRGVGTSVGARAPVEEWGILVRLRYTEHELGSSVSTRQAARSFARVVLSRASVSCVKNVVCARVNDRCLFW